jgi:hypothetical protein
MDLRQVLQRLLDNTPLCVDNMATFNLPYFEGRSLSARLYYD